MKTDFPAERAIRWAVLMAYARNLPTALERVTVRQQAWADFPGIGRQGWAYGLARESGLLHASDLSPTEAGIKFAQQLLGHLQQEEKDTVTNSANVDSDPLALWLQQAIAFYDRQLQDPAVMEAPNVGHLQDIREILKFNLEEGVPSFSRNEAYALLVAQRHMQAGISSEELGLAVSEERTKAEQVVTQSVGEMLLPHLEKYGPNARRIVRELADGVLPAREEVPTLLAAMTDFMRRPRRRRANA